MFNNLLVNSELYIRIFRLFYIFVSSFIGFYITNLSNHFIYKLPFNSRLNLIKTITTKLEDMNIVYVKIFQSLCLDDNLLYENEKEYLIKYTDSVPFTKDDINYDILDTLRTNYDIKIESYTPVNSGVVSVVFTGIYNNENVVIKVLKNNILHRLNIAFEDVELLLKMGHVFSFIRKMNLKKCFIDNKELLIEQTNFIKEANNIETFKRKIQNYKEYIIPFCYKEITLTHNNVIIMKNIKNLVYNDIKNYNKTVKNEFGKLLIKFGLISVLFTSAVHCDLHNGNVFFYINEEDNDKPKYQLGIIDFGIVAYPNRENQNNYYNFLKNIQQDKDVSKIEEVLYSILNEQIRFKNLELLKKAELLKKVSEIMIKDITYESHNMEIVINMSRTINSYGFSFTKEFNQICLSMRISANMAMNLLININQTQQEILNSFYNINLLIDI
jgi:ubiquinone biosynthesis protein